jgi:hypothetical protein
MWKQFHNNLARVLKVCLMSKILIFPSLCMHYPSSAHVGEATFPLSLITVFRILEGEDAEGSSAPCQTSSCSLKPLIKLGSEGHFGFQSAFHSIAPTSSHMVLGSVILTIHGHGFREQTAMHYECVVGCTQPFHHPKATNLALGCCMLLSRPCSLLQVS